MPVLWLKKITLTVVAAGYVTFYNPIGKNLSCPRILGEPKWKWKYHGKHQGVAHRWLPCGTVIYIKIGKHIIKTRVLDRGPYGAVDKDGKIVNASPSFLKKWWKKYYLERGINLTEEEEKRLSMVLPEGWRWRSTVDILYSLKQKLKTKGGRQPGIIAIKNETWEEVKNLMPENESFLIPLTFKETQTGTSLEF